MSKTIGEIVIAIIIAVLIFRIGIELAPLVAEWWRDMNDAVNDSVNDEERNNHDHQ